MGQKVNKHLVLDLLEKKVNISQKHTIGNPLDGRSKRGYLSPTHISQTTQAGDENYITEITKSMQGKNK